MLERKELYTKYFSVRFVKLQFVFLLFVIFIVSSCATSLTAPPPPSPDYEADCAQKRLDVSYFYHSKAKEFLSSYYKTRKESVLYFSWYAVEDSSYMARTVAKCVYKQNNHFYAMQNVIIKNIAMQKLIINNMRETSENGLSAIYLDEYRKIFPRDIR